MTMDDDSLFGLIAFVLVVGFFVFGIITVIPNDGYSYFVEQNRGAYSVVLYAAPKNTTVADGLSLPEASKLCDQYNEVLWHNKNMNSR
jgi:hypothetical protein